MNRNDRIREAIDRAFNGAGRAAGPSPAAVRAFAIEAKGRVLSELARVPVVPDYIKIEGVDYSIQAVEDIKAELGALRDHAKASDQARWVLILDHALVYLSYLIDIAKETTDE